MVAQLSTSQAVTQLNWPSLFIAWLTVAILTLDGTSSYAQGSDWQQPTEVERRVEPLSAIDQQFMAQQRGRVEAMANGIGRRLSGQKARDIDTLQQLLGRGMVDPADTLTLQAMGVVLGDLLAKELRMDWVVYRDRAGRSRALRFQQSDIYLYPVTMISRRWGVGSQKPVQQIFDDAVANTLPLLPGSRWR